MFMLAELYICMCAQRSQKLIYLQNADKLTSVISVHKALHWTLYHLWFQNKFESSVCVYMYTLMKNGSNGMTDQQVNI